MLKKNEVDYIKEEIKACKRQLIECNKKGYLDSKIAVQSRLDTLREILEL